MVKILTILGTRPQFVKAASLSRSLANYDLEEVIVHTGQHYDINMSEIFFDQMQIPKPDYFLGITENRHGIMTGKMMDKIEEVVCKESPDWMLVYGDTNSTLAGALVASKLPVRLAHIEAGLRSFNMNMPEEVNRVLTDRVSDALFCPTQKALDNLKKEGLDNIGVKIAKVGDIMYDGVLHYKNFASKPNIPLDKKFILATIHRQENTDNKNRLIEIVEAINLLAKEQQVVLPLHPRTKKMLDKYDLCINCTLVDPLGYLQMIFLLEHCSLVITDSGGLQKEAYFFGKPCITLRDETEWVELVDAGFSILVKANKDEIIQAISYEFATNHSEIQLYGEGNTADKIIEILKKI